MFRFASLHAPSRDAAADATQETFLWLSTHGATGFDSSRSSLAAFLCGVARNHGLQIRAVEARFTELPDDDEGSSHDGSAVIDDALAHLLTRERGDALLGALALLPAEHREVIALVEFEDFSYADAASIIGCPIGTVRSRLSRAKEALRDRVLELFPPQTLGDGTVISRQSTRLLARDREGWLHQELRQADGTARVYINDPVATEVLIMDPQKELACKAGFDKVAINDCFNQTKGDWKPLGFSFNSGKRALA